MEDIIIQAMETIKEEVVVTPKNQNLESTLNNKDQGTGPQNRQHYTKKPKQTSNLLKLLLAIQEKKDRIRIRNKAVLKTYAK